MKTNSISTAFLALTLLLVSCSGDSGVSKFLGFWVEEDSELIPATEIKKEGDHIFILVGDEDETEIPATYDREQDMLKAQYATPMGSMDIQVTHLEESGQLKINVAGKSTAFTKITEAEADELERKIAEYFSPDFYVGKWVNVKAPDGEGIEVSKEGDAYYLHSSFGKQKINYTDKQFNGSFMGNSISLNRMKNGNLQYGVGGLRSEYKKVE